LSYQICEHWIGNGVFGGRERSAFLQGIQMGAELSVRKRAAVRIDVKVIGERFGEVFKAFE